MLSQNNNQLQTEDLSPEQKLEQLAIENRNLSEELTKRNFDFMFQFMKEMRARDSYHGNLIELENEMLKALVAGQKEGKTAKHLFGTVTGYVREVETRPTKEDLAPSPFWQIWIEGGLLIGGAFSALAGLTLLMGNGSENAQSTGLTSLIINFIVGGLVMAILTKYQPDFNKPKGERGMWRYILVAVLTLAAWLGFISLTTMFVPNSLNPVMPAFIYIAIAIIAFVIRWWFKREFNVKGGIF